MGRRRDESNMERSRTERTEVLRPALQRALPAPLLAAAAMMQALLFTSCRKSVVKSQRSAP